MIFVALFAYFTRLETNIPKRLQESCNDIDTGDELAVSNDVGNYIKRQPANHNSVI